MLQEYTAAHYEMLTNMRKQLDDKNTALEKLIQQMKGEIETKLQDLGLKTDL
jgi:uncharacterized protein YukE